MRPWRAECEWERGGGGGGGGGTGYNYCRRPQGGAESRWLAGCYFNWSSRIAPAGWLAARLLPLSLPPAKLRLLAAGKYARSLDAARNLTPSLNRVLSSPDLHLHHRPAFLLFDCTVISRRPHRTPTAFPGPVALHLSSGCDPHYTTTSLGARHLTSTMSKGVQQDSLIFDDDEEETCPLCVEEFDLTDKGFKPCPCGYQVCFPFRYPGSVRRD